jgi:tetratricopeptide (TPR) repeat protein
VACCLISDTFEKEGDYANEIDWYTKAIQLDKESPKAYNYLAWLLATCPKAEFRNGTKAVEQATKACELSEWKNMSIIDTLAAAYAESGDFDKAVKWESKVLDAYPSNDSIKTRLALYQKHQPYHEPPK